MPTERDPGTGEAGEPGPVPYARFKEVNDKWKAAVEGHRTALADADRYKRELAAAEARLGTVDQLTARLQEMEASHAKDRASWDVERSLMDAGIVDQDGRDVARFLFDRLPEEGRPALGDWLKEAKADPSKAPKALQPYLGAASSDAGAGAEGVGAGPTLPDSQRGTGGNKTPDNTGFTGEQIRNMDMATYEKNRTAILEQYGHQSS